MYRLTCIVLVLVGCIQAYAQSPHGNALKMDCAACHNASGWLPVRDTLHFDHNSTSFPLDGLHKQAECRECHISLDFAKASNQCIDCHTDVHSMSVGNNCARCHSTQSWIVDNIPEMHEANGFPLVGTHSSASCVDCHISETNLKFNPIGNDCINCHRNDYQSTTNPNHEKAGYSTNCTECHDPFSIGWNADPDLVNHDFFPLTMGHDNVDCKQCHLTSNYSDASPECVSCHLDNYSATTNPNHAHANFSNNCVECHNTGAWSPASFDHNAVYPLLGAHASIASNCAECHVNGYSNTPTTCVGCHLPDYNATANPNHKTAQFPTDCKVCHSETAWIPSDFDHNTIYPLVGAHQPIANNCNLCHAAGYVNTPNTCVGCHLPDYNATANPNHKTAQFPTDCKVCHSETAWIPSDFDHNTIYPLVGAHQPIANNCNLCHAAGYVNTPNTCVGCHLPDYNATANPNHKTAQFPTDCKVCHSETAWIPSDFDHNTIYPLVGAHQPIANNCNLCHAAGYVNTPNTCVGCHLPDYNATANPNHKTAQFPTDCKVCHSETAWIPSDFDHNTIYPLVGAHQPIANNCNLCHAAGYVNTPNTCVGCHLPDYNATANPNHKTAQFPTDCKVCHSETAWIPSDFDHNTIYPLVGAHQPIANNCNLCHAAGYVNTPNTCVGCHLPDYNATANPNHKTAQFPTDCKVCHSETAWIPSDFDHNTVHPLLGAHKAVANNCNLCHAQGYTNTPNTCAGCHLTDYNTTTNPNHKAAQFPTDCKQCHGESAWTPAEFDHDGMYFPIYSGKHKEAWSSCTECHLNSSNYSVFSCINCHEHNNQTKVNNDHKDVRNYTYDSNACFSCHPDGRN